MNQIYIITSVILAAVGLSGCSTFEEVAEVLPDKRVEYKNSRVGKTLEIPPDLTSSTVQDSLAIPDLPGEQASFSEYRPNTALSVGATVPVGALNFNANVLPTQDNIRVERDGDKRWLVIDAEPDQVWPKLREFWIESGFLLKLEDPRIGIMETDWAENRADIKDDFVRNFLKKALDSLYSAATRDKFRIRLEKGASLGTTELYLSHKGMEEVVASQSGGGSDTTIWQPRKSDPELEAEMLNRVMVFFGVQDQKAERLLAKKQSRKPRAQLIKDGQGDASIIVDEAFIRAWRLTGLALDRVGFAVEDRDRSRGLFYVRYSDPFVDDEEEGFFSKLAFWSSKKSEDKNQYIVFLREGGASTRIVVLDEEGQPVKNSTATRILTLLHDQLQT